MEMEEIVKLLIAVAILILLIGAATLLLSGKGGEIFANMKGLIRLGR